MVDVLLFPLYATIYQGLKETWKFQYYTPQLTKKVKGNSGWMEVRFRHPSPGNDPVNEQHAAREHLRHHFKVPYPYSRYYVRNFWDPKFEDGVHSDVRIYPDISTFTADQEGVYLGYIKGDDIGNQAKKENYMKTAGERMLKNNPKEWTPELRKRINSDVRPVFKELRDNIDEKIKLDHWEDTADFPGASPYYHNPDTFLMDYGQVHVSSYEMQLYLELEHAIEGVRDTMEKEGVPTVEGNSSNWKLLDNTHRKDQQTEVARSLKQRNIKTIS